VIFRQAADPEVDQIDVAIGLLEPGGNFGIRGDIRKRLRPAQAKSFAQLVIGRQAEIAPALDVERGEIGYAVHRHVELEGTKVIDNLVIQLLRRAVGKAAQNWIDSAVCRDSCR
jgi:hypothetical protein